jgi:hypothetical protein
MSRESSAKKNRCRREVPVSWKDVSGALIEGVIDLVFEDGKQSTIVDFKSDEELRLLIKRSVSSLYFLFLRAAPSVAEVTVTSAAVFLARSPRAPEQATKDPAAT